MKKISGKTLKITLLLLSVLLIAALAAAAVFGYYMPQQRRKFLESDYLVQNQKFFRVSSLARTGAASCQLRDLELGISGKELLTAPEAELQFNAPFFGTARQMEFEKLLLKNCRITVASDKQQILINGHTLTEFARGISQLPPAPNGRMVPLEICGDIQLGQTGSPLPVTLQISCETAQKLRISAHWQQGSWDAFLDLSGNLLSVTFQGSVNMALWQELMLRSSVPPALVRLLAQADLQGSGKLAGDLQKLQISNLDATISAANAALNWYGRRINNLQKIDFSIRKDAPDITVKIPQIAMESPTAGIFKDVELTYTLQKDLVKLRANSDLRQLLVSFFCRSLGLPSVAVKSQSNLLSGSWNIRNGDWSLSTAPAAGAGNLELDSSAGTSLVLTPGAGEFQARGSGAMGQMQHNFDFTQLEMHTPQGVSRVDKGNIFARVNFGRRHRMAEDTVEFNFANFTMDFPDFQLEIPGFAGEFNLRTDEKNQREIYLITRGLASHGMGKNWKVELDSFKSTLNMENSGDLKSWKISGIDFTSPTVKAEWHGKNYTFNRTAVRGGGALSDNHLTAAELRLSADDMQSTDCSITRPVLDLDYSTQRRLAQRFNCTLTSALARLPENPWHIRSFSQGKVQFSTGDFKTAPEEFSIQADALSYQSRHLTADLQKSSIVVSKKSPENFTGKINFAFMKVNTASQKAGQGSFSTGSLDIAWQQANSASHPEKFSAVLTCAQPAWQYLTLHTGASSGTAKIEYNAAAEPVFQGSITMKQPTLLGSFFSAIGENMTNSFSGNPGNITGMLNLTGASITSPSGDIELKGVELVLPYLAASALPGELAPGKLTARELYCQQQPEGAFSATLRHGWNLKTSAHTLQMDGVLKAAKFSGRPFKVQTLWQLPPSASSEEWAFDLPESKLAMPLDLNRYMELAAPLTALKGSFAFNGKLKKSAQTPAQGSLKLTSVNSDWQIGSMTAEGVTSTAQLDIYDRKTMLLPHNISAAKLIWQNFVLLDNELNISGNASGGMLLSNWQGRFDRGKFNLTQPVQLKSFTGKNPADIPATLFEVQNLPAEKFFRSIGLKYLAGSMPLSGQLRPRVQNGKLVFDQSTLTSRTPAGALLKLALPDKNMLRVRNKAYQAFAMAVLKAMKTTQTQFDFTSEPNEIAMQVKAEGTPAEPIPFVYTGSNPPFRPAEPGEEGFDGEIELNINLKLRPDLPGF